jgi:hypothetical protein
MTTVPELGEQVADALAPTEGRHRAEQLRAGNDATVQRLAARGYQIGAGDITSLHLAVLLDTLLGDLDDPRRQAYEIDVHTKLSGLLADIETQIARATLLAGVQQDSIKLQRPGGPR